MIDNITKTIALEIPPCPSLIYHNYRYFLEDERHVDRISNCFVLIFMFESTLYFTEDDKDIEVNSGECYIQMPGLKQEGRKGSPSPIYFYIHFNARLFEDQKGEFKGSSPFILFPVRGKFNAKYIIPLLEQIVFLSNQHPQDLIGIQTVFLSILKYISTEANTSSKDTPDISSQVIEYLKENYTKNVTCNDLTNKFHFTADYLIRKMKNLYGITPWQYILFLRIEHSKELLCSTDYTLATVANEVGFNDLSVFYKSFKKQTGTAPGVWRKTSRN